MKVLIVGDAHGYAGLYAAARLAVDVEADRIIQLGDAWDINLPMRDGPPMDIIPGNHEQWDLWARNTFGKNIVGHTDYTTFPIGDRSAGVLGRIDDTPKVRELMDAGSFLGEPDKIFFHRLDGQSIRETFGRIVEHEGRDYYIPCDILLFHDAPYPFVLGHRPLPPVESYREKAGPEIVHTEVVGSEYLGELVRTVGPKYAFHGHMHLLDIRYIGKTRVFGLPPIDPIFEHRGYVLLDTGTMRADYYDL